MARNWYAALMNNEDNDWGTGSFDRAEAEKIAKSMGDESIVAEIDGGYDEDGNSTTDPICVAEYHNGIDF